MSLLSEKAPRHLGNFSTLEKQVSGDTSNENRAKNIPTQWRKEALMRPLAELEGNRNHYSTWPETNLKKKKRTVFPARLKCVCSGIQ